MLLELIRVIAIAKLVTERVSEMVNDLDIQDILK